MTTRNRPSRRMPIMVLTTLVLYALMCTLAIRGQILASIGLSLVLVAILLSAAMRFGREVEADLATVQAGKGTGQTS